MTRIAPPAGNGPVPARVLLVDNYDSFTYNLAHLLAEAGAEVEVQRNDAVDGDGAEAYAPTHLVISPGPGRPADAGVSTDLVRRFAGRIPVLGVCLGHQCIVEAFGGTVGPAQRLMHGKTGQIVRTAPDPLLEDLAGEFEAGRYHSLAATAVPADLEVTARDADGEVMAVQHRALANVHGLQFHPESVLTPDGAVIARRFLALEGDRRPATTPSAAPGPRAADVTVATALAGLLAGHSLTAAETEQVMDAVMRGEVPESQIAGLLVALRLKGETVDEIAGAARAMRRAAVATRPARQDLVDTAGTGGDGRHTFNISTVAGLVAAGAGAGVAKHGNRAVSSSCGSADVLEALEVPIHLRPEQVAACIDEVGFGFLFAQSHHPAMRHAGPVRRALGVRTIFNVLGPLTNPVGARRQLVGVFAEDLVRPLAEVLQALGCEHALVVHGYDGIDELSPAGPSICAVATPDGIRVDTVDPRALGLDPCTTDDLHGGDPRTNAEIALRILDGEPGPGRDAVLLNAAAALVAAGRAVSLADGLEHSASAVDSGAARTTLDRLRAFAQEAQ
jgi:anthranilate synthase/phosphoribosyltransferase